MSEIQMLNTMQVCQKDYPLDHYQPEFIPYAEEYIALPDRELSTILKWMTPYMEKAKAYFGDELLLVAHYYMGGEIVKIIEQFGGYIGDSYQLAVIAKKHIEKSIIVESAVHFMAESISILAHPHQKVYITNPKSGCTMEMLAKDYMVEPAFRELNEIYGAENILPICYMNTSGRLKAMTGAQNGAVCTSSNVKKIFEWGLAQGKKILFIPDQHMGENVAGWLNIPPEKIAYWPAGNLGATYSLYQVDEKVRKQFDNASLILFSSFCGVHTVYEPEMVKNWQAQDYAVVVHPECRKVVVDLADGIGSTAFIWDYVMHDRAKKKKYAVATENHMVENLKQACIPLGIEVTNLAAGKNKVGGCGCATMSRNDPPHLVGLLDLLRKGHSLDTNQVKAGDQVNEFTGKRDRFSEIEQQQLIINARKALENMIKITETG